MVVTSEALRERERERESILLYPCFIPWAWEVTVTEITGICSLSVVGIKYAYRTMSDDL